MTEVSRNHLLFRIELNSRSASSIRFWGGEGKEEEERTHRRGHTGEEKNKQCGLGTIIPE